MKIVDLLLVISIFFGVYRGFIKGIVVELISLVVGGLAIYSSIQLLPYGLAFYARFFDYKISILQYLVFALLLLVSLTVFISLGRWFKYLIKPTILGVIDRALGSILGGVKMTLLISAMFFISNKNGFCVPIEYTDGTVIFPYVVQVAPKLLEVLYALWPELEKNINNLYL